MFGCEGMDLEVCDFGRSRDIEVHVSIYILRMYERTFVPIHVSKYPLLVLKLCGRSSLGKLS